MSDYRDHLRPASFRGVPFEVVISEAEFGRNTADHEYPQRDKPFIEDLGRGMRGFHLSGFVKPADDYFTTRDRLIAAAEEEGPGTLVHPFYGTLTVSIPKGGLKVRESWDNGRCADLDWTFLESGEASFPTEYLFPDDVLDAAALSGFDAMKADFLDGFVTALAAGFLVLEAITTVQTWSRKIRAAVLAPIVAAGKAVGAAQAGLDALDAAVVTLVTTPEALADALLGVLQQIDELSAFDGLTDLAGQADDDPGTTPADAQIAANATAVRRLVTRTSLCQQAKAAAAFTFYSYDEAISARDVLADRISNEAEVGASDDAFTALVDVRTAMVSAVTDRAATLGRLRTFTPRLVTCSLVLAHDLYGDATRGDEIVARNGLSHPAFIAPQPLRVLSV